MTAAPPKRLFLKKSFCYTRLMVIVTAGQKYNDIDALACAIAYQELLTLQGTPAQAVLSGPLNNSVTALVRQNKLNYTAEYLPSPDDTFVLVDISNPEYVSNFVNIDQVVRVFDHHYGHEEFWKNKIGDNSKIEMIGAAATLIFEEFQNSGLLSKISKESANLLSFAIVSNTLNFTIDITDQRDKNALEELSKYTNLPEDWIAQYFTEQSQETFKNPKAVLQNDTKTEQIHGLDKPLVIGQLELWDGSGFLEQHKATLRSAMKEFNNPNWLVTIPSISEKRNYIYCENEELQSILFQVFNITFSDNVGTTSRIMLRKQILKALHKR